MEKTGKKKLLIIYLCSLGIGAVALFFSYLYMEDNKMEVVMYVAGALWGAFTFLANREKLPEEYNGKRNGSDSLVFHGLYVMKMPGIVFTDRNWPYVVILERIWSCMLMALYPMVSLLWYLYDKLSWEETKGMVIVLFFVTYIMLMKLVTAKYE